MPIGPAITGQDRAVATSGFPRDYEVVVDPEYPPDGDWRVPVFAFDPTGRPAADGVARHGTAVAVLVRPADGGEWLATFPAGESTAVGVHSTPSPEHLCVLAGGSAHLVRATAPAAGAPVVQELVEQVALSVDPPLLLLVGDLGLTALGPHGLAWRAEDWWALEDIRVHRADADGVRCTGTAWDDSPVEFVLDPVTGRSIEEPSVPPWRPPPDQPSPAPRRRWWRR